MLEFLNQLDVILSALDQFVTTHPYWAMGALTLAGAVYNAFVQSLPKPRETSGMFYEFFYSFTHLVAFNFKHSAQSFRERPSAIA